ncbi:MAG TPA: MFS transporter [Candidatus Limnocylindria bacterium]|nr:MFS transporter [Candidatus Limnocylindria bacterium]
MTIQPTATMDRSLWSVIFGTFTLRFSTGLTGGLLVYYLADLPSHGGAEVSAFMLGLLGATYFVAELVLSPGFGVLSDRLGAHRVMQWGPVFGAVAVILTAFTTDLFLLGTTRWLEGAAAGASIPSILGYIALATTRDELLRGKAVARFEAATLAGIGVGIVAAGPLYEGMSRSGFLLNAGIYAVSYAIYRWGVREVGPASTSAGEQAVASVRDERFSLARYRAVLASPGVWLLAPTWIALNAVLGSWSTQSVFQLVREPSDAFSGQLLMGGFAPTQVSIGLAIALVVFFAGLFYWGNRFKSIRRTTIIGIGILGGLAMMGAIFAINHSQGLGLLLQVPMLALLLGGLFVLAGATPAALGLLADISESHPDDRGAIMGLYSVFLAVGQIVGALVSGWAADWLGIDGLLAASLGLLVVAVLPLQRLRASEHLVGARISDIPDLAAG